MVETLQRPADHHRYGHGHMPQGHIEDEHDSDLTEEEQLKELESNPSWLEWKEKFRKIPQPRDTDSATFLSQLTRNLYSQIFKPGPKDDFLDSLPHLDGEWDKRKVNPEIYGEAKSLYNTLLSSKQEIRDADQRFGGRVREMAEQEIRNGLSAWSSTLSEKENSMTLPQSYEADKAREDRRRPPKVESTRSNLAEDSASLAEEKERKASMRKRQRKSAADEGMLREERSDRTGTSYNKDTTRTLERDRIRSGVDTDPTEQSKVSRRKERHGGGESSSNESNAAAEQQRVHGQAKNARPKDPRKHLSAETRDETKTLDATKQSRKPIHQRDGYSGETSVDGSRPLTSILKKTPQDFSKSRQGRRTSEDSQPSTGAVATSAGKLNRYRDSGSESESVLHSDVDTEPSPRRRHKQKETKGRNEPTANDGRARPVQADRTNPSKALIPYSTAQNSSQESLKSGPSRRHKNRNEDMQDSASSETDTKSPRTDSSVPSRDLVPYRGEGKRRRETGQGGPLTKESSSETGPASEVSNIDRSTNSRDTIASSEPADGRKRPRQTLAPPITFDTGSGSTQSEKTDSSRSWVSTANPDTQLAIRKRSQLPQTDEKSQLVKFDDSSTSLAAADERQVASVQATISDRGDTFGAPSFFNQSRLTSSMFPGFPNPFDDIFTRHDEHHRDISKLMSAWDPIKQTELVSTQFSNIPNKTLLHRFEGENSAAAQRTTVTDSGLMQSTAWHTWGPNHVSSPTVIGSLGKQNDIMAN
ncbi:MAG: hypothetical protein TREMPRED_003844 [Tremellales sp. Tagirdzhanova-0007]|nr:MAG: hypothetical protein TREMPRED_003844 [Tremellales sp. Tagirdzhanova-0007]